MQGTDMLEVNHHLALTEKPGYMMRLNSEPLFEMVPTQPLFQFPIVHFSH
jgi:hypothetical protein